MALTPELNAYFDNLDEMFGTAGWRQLVDGCVKEIYELQANALEATSYEELMFMRGQADILNRLVTYREEAEQTKASHEEEDTLDAIV